MGDGTLIEFGSVVDAVHFAVDVQRAMALRNTDVPEDQRITYRSGVGVFRASSRCSFARSSASNDRMSRSKVQSFSRASQ